MPKNGDDAGEKEGQPGYNESFSHTVMDNVKDNGFAHRG